MIIGCILVGTAVWLAYETRGLLIGESANRQAVKGTGENLQASPVVEQVNEVSTMHRGPDFILARLRVNFKNSIRAGDVEKNIAELDASIKLKYPLVKRIFIETEKIKLFAHNAV